VTPLFIDTGYLIALEVADDQYHNVAFKHWQGLLKSPLHLVTTSYVFSEIVTFFNSHNYQSKAIEIGSRLISSPSIKFIHIDESLFYKGWQYLKKHNDKSYSLTDCISFIIMTQLEIKTALSFDKHFMQAGFKKLP